MRKAATIFRITCPGFLKVFAHGSSESIHVSFEPIVLVRIVIVLSGSLELTLTMCKQTPVFKFAGPIFFEVLAEYMLLRFSFFHLL